MFNGSNTATLRLVAQEISRLCHEAGDALDNFAGNWSARDAIEPVLQNLLSMRGTFEMLELPAAKLLVEEGVSTLQALSFEDTPEARQQLETLGFGLALLARYVEYLVGKSHDIPELLLGPLNQLREQNKRAVYPAANFFVIKPPRVLQEAKDVNDLRFSGRRQRLLFQMGLVHVLTRTQIEPGLRLLRTSAERLVDMSPKNNADVWRLVIELVQAMPKKLPLDANLKRLLSQAERYLNEQLKAAKHEQHSTPPVALLQSLLYQSSLIESRPASVDKLLSDYGASLRPLNHNDLNEAYLRLHAPAESTYRAVVEHVRDELAGIHGDLSQRVMTSPGSDVDGIQLGETARRLGQTLILAEQLSYGESLVVAADAITQAAVRPLVACHNAVQEFVNVCAQVKLGLDARLAASAVRSELESKEHFASTMDENRSNTLADLRSNLQDVMQSFDNYVASDSQRSHILQVPEILQRLCHALTFSHLELLAEPLQHCLVVINEAIAPDNLRPLSRDILHTMADVFTATDYALECLLNQQPVPSHVKELTSEALRDLARLRAVA